MKNNNEVLLITYKVTNSTAQTQGNQQLAARCTPLSSSVIANQEETWEEGSECTTLFSNDQKLI